MPHPRVASPVVIEAVIFDVDGVLVQSMERHYEAYKRAFATIGVDIQPRDVYANEGRRSREVIESLAEERKLGLDAAKLDALNRMKQDTFASFGPLPFYPGARELVERIRARGLMVAAVTGTARVNVDNHFGEFTTAFDVIVTADDVTRTKPDPEPYLAALRKLGVVAESAVVVENATLGIRSAKSAGIRVVAIASTLPESTLREETDEVVPRISDVWRVLEATA